MNNSRATASAVRADPRPGAAMTRRHHDQPADETGQPVPGASDAAGVSERANGATADGENESNMESLRAQLSEEKTRADGYLAQWQRAAADFQNFKRRTEQERDEYGRLANMAFIINILPAVDDLDRALANVDTTLAG